MDQPIISVRDLTVRYGDQRVLDHVNLDIARGEVMVLLGGSGSGKTTMLRHHRAWAAAAEGTIVVQGVDINRCTASELKAVRRTMGVAFQESALFNSLSIEANLALPLRELTTLADPVIEIMIYLKLASVVLAEVEKMLPQELSGGMKKRAAVARATALDPEILVFDEASAGLDPIVAAELDELILLLNRLFHMTMLVVTHELASAFRIADHCHAPRNAPIAVDGRSVPRQHPSARPPVSRPNSRSRRRGRAIPAAPAPAGRLDCGAGMKSTEAKVGAFVVICAAILCAAVYSISNVHFAGAHVPYRTYLRYAGGLEPGTPVLFGGIAVGRVTGVAPDPSDPTKIEIDLDVKQGIPVNAKSVAKLGIVS